MRDIVKKMKKTCKLGKSIDEPYIQKKDCVHLHEECIKVSKINTKRANNPIKMGKRLNS